MLTSHRLSEFDHHAWQRRLTTAVDLGIASTVLVAPLFMGGRGPVGRLVLALCVAVTALMWCARQCLGERAAWRRSGTEGLLLAGFALLLLQLAPLPQYLLVHLSPSLSEMLPLWIPDTANTFQLGTWSRVSLNPIATQNGFSTYLGYATLFCVVFQRFESRHDVEKLLRLIAIATCLMALLGLAQFLGGNGKYLWVFEHVSRDASDVVKGPFQNQNHFAHLLALGIGPLLWWLSSLQAGIPKQSPRTFGSHLDNSILQSQILWIALGTVTFAALLTFSRGGVMATLLAAGSGLAILSWKQLLSRRALSVVAVIAGLMVVSLSIHGYEPLARKLGSFTESNSIDDLSHGRWALWNAHFKAIPDFWIAGSGVGTHRDIYPTYLAEHFDVEFTHGESGYLQLLLETGLIGTSLLLVGLYLAFRWSLIPLLRESDRANAACAAAILPGLLASVFHSLGDFVWYIPACMTTTVLLLAGACYLYRVSATQESSPHPAAPIALASQTFAPRWVWLGLSATCVIAFALVTSRLLPPAVAATHWYAYQRLVRATPTAAEQATRAEDQDLGGLTALVAATVAADPNDARAQARLAGLYLQQFDLAQQHSQNPMPLSQIRDAAFASQFPSKQELDAWLDLAVGENRRWFDKALAHARRSVRLCPLQGDAYALLARVAFLEGPDANRKRQYVEQALRVRPYDSRVQFVAGQETLLEGNVDAAFTHWKQAFHGEREVQDELIRELTGVIPASDLLAALAPEQRGLDALLTHYKRIGAVDDAKLVAAYYARQLQERLRRDPQINRLGVLNTLSSLHEYLEAPEEAIRLAHEASRLAPTNFKLKLRLGRLLLNAGRFPEAQAELQWCVRRQPDHAETRQLLATATRGSLARQADASHAQAKHQTIGR